VTLDVVAPTAARTFVEAGATVLLDVRAPADFARGHPAGALSVPFSAKGLARRVGNVLPRGSSVIIIAPDDGSADSAAAQLEAADVRVRGALAGGFDAWHAAELPEAATGQLTVDELSQRAPDVTLIDVREPLEWATGYVPGALLVPLGELRAALPSIPLGGPVIAICEAGIRSCTAASILAAAGIADVAHVPAGSSGYRKAGLPLAFPATEEVRTG
jgi:hydroxyacylglutathione hydrolase